MDEEQRADEPRRHAAAARRCCRNTPLPQYAAARARCCVRFIEEYPRQGVPVWRVSVQTEPAATQRCDSCLYSADEERDFVRDHLGPALAWAGLGHVKVITWDPNRDLLVERASVAYADAEAAKYIWGTGFHWDGEDHLDHVQLMYGAWPDKPLLFTEGCQEGGPNHVGNLCRAPILAGTANNALLRQSSYFYIGRFARFAKAGARRVLCAAKAQRLEATAFVNPDGAVATGVMNRSEAAITVVLRCDGLARHTELPPRLIATYLTG